MMGWQRPKARPWLRTVSCFTALIFTVTTVGWADGANAIHSAFAKNKSPLQTLDLNFSTQNLFSTVSLPESAGQIKKSFQGSGDKILLHIQDAHVNEEAQRNIAGILKFFSTNHGLKLVNLEGAEGKLLTQAYSFFPVKKVRRQVSDYFLKEGRLSGPEYLAIVEQPDLELYGIEDNKIYEENRYAYLSAVRLKSRDEKILLGLGKVLRDIARFVFSEELRELARRRESIAVSGRQLITYAEFLFEAANRHGISLHSYPAAQALLSMIALEWEIAFENVQRELEALLGRLKKELPPERLMQFLASTAQFQRRQMKRADYYKYLEEEISGAAFIRTEREKYISVIRYLEYTRLFDSLSPDLLDELPALEREVKGKIFRSKEEERLDHLLGILEIYKKLFDFTLTKQDAEFFYKHRDEFSAQTFREFLEPLLKRYRFENQLPPDLEKLDQDLERIERFYGLALKRDRILVQKAIQKMEEGGEKIAALVTGGFHTPGIEKYLRERGYSYLVVTPRIAQELDAEKEKQRYENALRREPMNLEKLLAETLLPSRSSALNDPSFQLVPERIIPAEMNALLENSLAASFLAHIILGTIFYFKSPETAHSEIRKALPSLPDGDLLLDRIEDLTRGVYREGPDLQLFYRIQGAGKEDVTLYAKYPLSKERSELRSELNKRLTPRRHEIQLGNSVFAAVANVQHHLIPDDVLNDLKTLTLPVSRAEVRTEIPGEGGRRKEEDEIPSPVGLRPSASALASPRSASGPEGRKSPTLRADRPGGARGEVRSDDWKELWTMLKELHERAKKGEMRVGEFDERVRTFKERSGLLFSRITLKSSGQHVEDFLEGLREGLVEKRIEHLAPKNDAQKAVFGLLLGRSIAVQIRDGNLFINMSENIGEGYNGIYGGLVNKSLVNTLASSEAPELHQSYLIAYLPGAKKEEDWAILKTTEIKTRAKDLIRKGPDEEAVFLSLVTNRIEVPFSPRQGMAVFSFFIPRSKFEEIKKTLEANPLLVSQVSKELFPTVIEGGRTTRDGKVSELKLDKNFPAIFSENPPVPLLLSEQGINQGLDPISQDDETAFKIRSALEKYKVKPVPRSEVRKEIGGGERLDQVRRIWPPFSRMINPFTFSAGTALKNFRKAAVISWAYGGWMRIWIILNSAVGKSAGLAKSLSRVIKILFSFFARFAISKSGEEGATRTASWSDWVRNFSSLIGTSSSIKNFMPSGVSGIFQKEGILDSWRFQLQNAMLHVYGRVSGLDNILGRQFPQVLLLLQEVPRQRRWGYGFLENRAFRVGFGDPPRYIFESSHPSKLTSYQGKGSTLDLPRQPSRSEVRTEEQGRGKRQEVRENAEIFSSNLSPLPSLLYLRRSEVRSNKNEILRMPKDQAGDTAKRLKPGEAAGGEAQETQVLAATRVDQHRRIGKKLYGLEEKLKELQGQFARVSTAEEWMRAARYQLKLKPLVESVFKIRQEFLGVPNKMSPSPLSSPPKRGRGRGEGVGSQRELLNIFNTWQERLKQTWAEVSNARDESVLRLIRQVRRDIGQFASELLTDIEPVLSGIGNLSAQGRWADFSDKVHQFRERARAYENRLPDFNAKKEQIQKELRALEKVVRVYKEGYPRQAEIHKAYAALEVAFSKIPEPDEMAKQFQGRVKAAQMQKSNAWLNWAIRELANTEKKFKEAATPQEWLDAATAGQQFEDDLTLVLGRLEKGKAVTAKQEEALKKKRDQFNQACSAAASARDKKARELVQEADKRILALAATLLSSNQSFDQDVEQLPIEGRGRELLEKAIELKNRLGIFTADQRTAYESRKEMLEALAGVVGFYPEDNPPSPQPSPSGRGEGEGNSGKQLSNNALAGIYNAAKQKLEKMNPERLGEFQRNKESAVTQKLTAWLRGAVEALEISAQGFDKIQTAEEWRELVEAQLRLKRDLESVLKSLEQDGVEFQGEKRRVKRAWKVIVESRDKKAQQLISRFKAQVKNFGQEVKQEVQRTLRALASLPTQKSREELLGRIGELTARLEGIRKKRGKLETQYTHFNRIVEAYRKGSELHQTYRQTAKFLKDTNLALEELRKKHGKIRRDKLKVQRVWAWKNGLQYAAWTGLAGSTAAGLIFFFFSLPFAFLSFGAVLLFGSALLIFSPPNKTSSQEKHGAARSEMRTEGDPFQKWITELKQLVDTSQEQIEAELPSAPEPTQDSPTSPALPEHPQKTEPTQTQFERSGQPSKMQIGRRLFATGGIALLIVWAGYKGIEFVGRLVGEFKREEEEQKIQPKPEVKAPPQLPDPAAVPGAGKPADQVLPAGNVPDGAKKAGLQKGAVANPLRQPREASALAGADSESIRRAVQFKDAGKEERIHHVLTAKDNQGRFMRNPLGQLLLGTNFPPGELAAIHEYAKALGYNLPEKQEGPPGARRIVPDLGWLERWLETPENQRPSLSTLTKEQRLIIQGRLFTVEDFAEYFFFDLLKDNGLLEESREDFRPLPNPILPRGVRNERDLANFRGRLNLTPPERADLARYDREVKEYRRKEAERRVRRKARMNFYRLMAEAIPNIKKIFLGKLASGEYIDQFRLNWAGNRLDGVDAALLDRSWRLLLEQHGDFLVVEMVGLGYAHVFAQAANHFEQRMSRLIERDIANLLRQGTLPLALRDFQIFQDWNNVRTSALSLFSANDNDLVAANQKVVEAQQALVGSMQNVRQASLNLRMALASRNPVTITAARHQLVQAQIAALPFQQALAQAITQRNATFARSSVVNKTAVNAFVTFIQTVMRLLMERDLLATRGRFMDPYVDVKLRQKLLRNYVFAQDGDTGQVKLPSSLIRTDDEHRLRLFLRGKHPFDEPSRGSFRQLVYPYFFAAPDAADALEMAALHLGMALDVANDIADRFFGRGPLNRLPDEFRRYLDGLAGRGPAVSGDALVQAIDQLYKMAEQLDTRRGRIPIHNNEVERLVAVLGEEKSMLPEQERPALGQGVLKDLAETIRDAYVSTPVFREVTQGIGGDEFVARQLMRLMAKNTTNELQGLTEPEYGFFFRPWTDDGLSLFELVLRGGDSAYFGLNAFPQDRVTQHVNRARRLKEALSGAGSYERLRRLPPTYQDLLVIILRLLRENEDNPSRFSKRAQREYHQLLSSLAIAGVPHPADYERDLLRAGPEVREKILLGDLALIVRAMLLNLAKNIHMASIKQGVDQIKRALDEWFESQGYQRILNPETGRLDWATVGVNNQITFVNHNNDVIRNMKRSIAEQIFSKIEEGKLVPSAVHVRYRMMRRVRSKLEELLSPVPVGRRELNLSDHTFKDPAILYKIADDAMARGITPEELLRILERALALKTNDRYTELVKAYIHAVDPRGEFFSPSELANWQWQLEARDLDQILFEWVTSEPKKRVSYRRVGTGLQQKVGLGDWQPVSADDTPTILREAYQRQARQTPQVEMRFGLLMADAEMTLLEGGIPNFLTGLEALVEMFTPELYRLRGVIGLVGQSTLGPLTVAGAAATLRAEADQRLKQTLKVRRDYLNAKRAAFDPGTRAIKPEDDRLLAGNRDEQGAFSALARAKIQTARHQPSGSLKRRHQIQDSEAREEARMEFLTELLRDYKRLPPALDPRAQVVGFVGQAARGPLAAATGFAPIRFGPTQRYRIRLSGPRYLLEANAPPNDATEITVELHALELAFQLAPHFYKSSYPNGNLLAQVLPEIKVINPTAYANRPRVEGLVNGLLLFGFNDRRQAQRAEDEGFMREGEKGYAKWVRHTVEDSLRDAVELIKAVQERLGDPEGEYKEIYLRLAFAERWGVERPWEQERERFKTAAQGPFDHRVGAENRDIVFEKENRFVRYRHPEVEKLFRETFLPHLIWLKDWNSAYLSRWRNGYLRDLRERRHKRRGMGAQLPFEGNVPLIAATAVIANWGKYATGEELPNRRQFLLGRMGEVFGQSRSEIRAAVTRRDFFKMAASGIIAGSTILEPTPARSKEPVAEWTAPPPLPDLVNPVPNLAYSIQARYVEIPEDTDPTRIEPFASQFFFPNARRLEEKTARVNQYLFDTTVRDWQGTPVAEAQRVAAVTSVIGQAAGGGLGERLTMIPNLARIAMTYFEAAMRSAQPFYEALYGPQAFTSRGGALPDLVNPNGSLAYRQDQIATMVPAARGLLDGFLYGAADEVIVDLDGAFRNWIQTAYQMASWFREGNHRRDLLRGLEEFYGRRLNLDPLSEFNDIGRIITWGRFFALGNWTGAVPQFFDFARRVKSSPMGALLYGRPLDMTKEQRAGTLVGQSAAGPWSGVVGLAVTQPSFDVENPEHVGIIISWADFILKNEPRRGDFQALGFDDAFDFAVSIIKAAEANWRQLQGGEVSFYVRYLKDIVTRYPTRNPTAKPREESNRILAEIFGNIKKILQEPVPGVPDDRGLIRLAAQELLAEFPNRDMPWASEEDKTRMVEYIQGGPDTPGLKDEGITAERAVYLAAKYMPSQGYSWRDLVDKFKEEMYYQTVYMTYNRDILNQPKRLLDGELGELRSRRLRERDRFSRETVGKIIKYISRFRAQEKELRNQLIEALKPQYGEVRANEIVTSFPSATIGQAEGYVIRLHEKEWDESRMQIDFQDMLFLQLLSYGSEKKFIGWEFIYPVLYEARGKRHDPLTDPQKGRFRSRFSGTHRINLVYMNLKDEGELLKFLLLKWRVDYGELLPAGPRTQLYLENLKSLAEELEKVGYSPGEIRRKQGELIERISGFRRTYIFRVAPYLFRLAKQTGVHKELLGTLEARVDQLERTMIPRLRELVLRIDPRRQEANYLTQKYSVPLKVLSGFPDRNRPYGDRVNGERKERTNQLHRIFQDWEDPRQQEERERLYNTLIRKALERYRIQLTADEVGVLTSIMLREGYSDDEVLCLHVDLRRRVEGTYKEKFKGNPGVTLNEEEKGIVTYYAEQISRLINFGSSTDQAEIEQAMRRERRGSLEASLQFLRHSGADIPSGLRQKWTEQLRRELQGDPARNLPGVDALTFNDWRNFELERISDVLELARHAQNKFLEVRVALTDEQARIMAFNAYMSVIKRDDLTRWVDTAKEMIDMFIQTVRELRAQAPDRVPTEEIIYDVDAMFELGLADPIRQRVLEEGVLREAISEGLEGLGIEAASDQINRIIVAMMERRIQPTAFSLLIIRVREVQSELEEIKERATRLSVFDPRLSPQQDWALMQPLSSLQILIYLDSMNTHPMSHIGLRNIFGFTREEVEQRIEISINAMYRFQIEDRLKLEVSRRIWQKSWSTIERFRYWLAERYGWTNKDTWLAGIGIWVGLSLLFKWLAARRHNIKYQREREMQLTSRQFVYRWIRSILIFAMVYWILIGLNFSFVSPSSVIFWTVTLWYLLAVVPDVYIESAFVAYVFEPLIYRPTVVPLARRLSGKQLRPSLLYPYRRGKLVPGPATGTHSVIESPPLTRIPDENKFIVSVAFIMRGEEGKSAEESGDVNNLDEVLGNPTHPDPNQRIGEAQRMLGNPATHYQMLRDSNLYFSIVLQVAPREKNDMITVSEDEFWRQYESTMGAVERRFNAIPEDIRRRLYIFVRPAKLTKPATHYMLQEWMMQPDGQYILTDPNLNTDPDYTAPGDYRFQRRALQPPGARTNRRIPFMTDSPADPDIQDPRFPGGIMGGDPTDPNDLRNIRERNIASHPDVDQRTNEIFATLVYDPGNGITYTDLLAAIEVVADPRNPHIMYQGNMDYKDKNATPHSLVMKSHPNRMLRFAWWSQQIIEGEMRPPGKYIYINTHKTLADGRVMPGFYRKVIRTRGYERHWSIAYKYLRNSDDIFHKGEDEFMGALAGGSQYVPWFTITEDPMYNRFQEKHREDTRWTPVFDLPTIVSRRIAPFIRDHPIIAAALTGILSAFVLTGIIGTGAGLTGLLTMLGFLIGGALIGLLSFGSLFKQVREKLLEAEAQGMRILPLTPGEKYESNKMIRGLISEIIWLLQLIVTFKAMLFPGTLEVLLPMMGELAFVTIIFLFIHPKFHPALGAFKDVYNVLKGQGEYYERYGRVIGFVFALTYVLGLILLGIVEFVASTAIFLFNLVWRPFLIPRQFLTTLHIAYFHIFGEHPKIVQWYYRNVLALPSSHPKWTTPPRLTWVAAVVGEGNPLFIWYLRIFRWGLVFAGAAFFALAPNLIKGILPGWMVGVFPYAMTGLFLLLWIVSYFYRNAFQLEGRVVGKLDREQREWYQQWQLGITEFKEGMGALFFFSAVFALSHALTQPYLAVFFFGVLFFLRWIFGIYFLRNNESWPSEKHAQWEKVLTNPLKNWAFYLLVASVIFSFFLLSPAGTIPKGLILRASTILLTSFGFTAGWSWFLGRGKRIHGRYIESWKTPAQVYALGILIIVVAVATTFFPVELHQLFTQFPILAFGTPGMDGGSTAYWFSFGHQLEMRWPWVIFFSTVAVSGIFIGLLFSFYGLVHSLYIIFIDPLFKRFTPVSQIPAASTGPASVAARTRSEIRSTPKAVSLRQAVAETAALRFDLMLNQFRREVENLDEVLFNLAWDPEIVERLRAAGFKLNVPTSVAAEGYVVIQYSPDEHGIDFIESALRQLPAGVKIAIFGKESDLAQIWNAEVLSKEIGQSILLPGETLSEFVANKRKTLDIDPQDILQFIVENQFKGESLRTVQAALLGAVPLSQGTIQIIGVAQDQKLGRQVSVIGEWIKHVVDAASALAKSA